MAMNVLITGCSSGFGELIAKTLASDGHHVFATMRDVSGRNAEAARGLSTWASDKGLHLSVLELDVTSDASVEQAVRQIDAVDVLVNNAGVAASGPLEGFTIDQVQELFGLNVFGALRVSDAVLPTMRERHSGLIVFITSTLGRVLPRRGGLYPSTKWALEGIAESLHYDLAPFGVDVAIVEPGTFPTPAISKGMRAERTEVVEAYARVAARPLAVPRTADPQEVADAIRALVDQPPGQRPLRTVVGPIFTEGVADYNTLYERTRERLTESLRRNDS